jgi:hypothetical protein
MGNLGNTGENWGLLTSRSSDLLNFNLSRAACMIWNPSRNKIRAKLPERPKVF